jgi:S4 domain protein YaaA
MPPSEAQPTSVPIYTEYITLGQLVKLLDLVGSGAEVKGFLANRSVQVNGEPDNRRGRKLYPGDVVKIEGRSKVQISRSPG